MSSAWAFWPLAADLGAGDRLGALRSRGFEAMVALFDSTITFHAQFQQSREMRR
jgi:hypothetical protein